MAWLLILLAFFVREAHSSGYCTRLNEFKDISWVRAGGDIPGFRFPGNISRRFHGVVDRQCGPYHAILNPRPNERDEQFCLPHFPFGKTQPEQVCNRCKPAEGNYYKFEIWRHLNTINKEYNHWKEWDPEDETFKFPFGFCLTCYAIAHKVNPVTPNDVREGRNVRLEQPFLKGVEYPLPAVPGQPEQNFMGTDVRKDSVTVTTRVACGKQREDEAFDAPTPQMLESYDRRMAALQPDPNDPCDHPIFPCGQERLMRNIERERNFTMIAQELDAEIMNYVKLDEHNEPVNGHHNTLMEIGHGQAHVLRTSMNLNDGFKGFTRGIPDGGYTSLNEDGEYEPYDGCQAIEYGMVAVSPGTVETACWLVPLKTKGEGDDQEPDYEALAEWTRNEEEKERAVLKKFNEGQQLAFQQILTYCSQFRVQQAKNTVIHEYATSFCETNFCIPQSQLQATAQNAYYNTICTEVNSDAATYKAIAKQRFEEAQKQQQQQQEQQNGAGNPQQNAWQKQVYVNNNNQG